jgi:transcriptional regulator with XRE-family HTH domain
MSQTDEFIIRLKNIREALDLRQHQIAVKLNISAPSYSEIEAGKYQPKYEFLYNLVKEFHVNLYYLMYGEGEMFFDPGNPFYKPQVNAIPKDKETQDFLWYFEHSSIVRLMTLASFKKIMQKENEYIRDEINALKEEK